MKQRAVLIALLPVFLMTVVGLVEVRGWEGLEKQSERVSNPPGCFDIAVHPVAARLTFVVNRCTGETWQLQEGSDGGLSWTPLRRHPTELLDLFEGLGGE